MSFALQVNVIRKYWHILIYFDYDLISEAIDFFHVEMMLIIY